MEKNFSVNLNNQATVENQTKSTKDDYVNLNCYKVVDGQPVWLFRVSTVPTQRVNTEAFLQKQLVEAYASKNIEAYFIEGNMKKEKEEMQADF